VFWFIFFILPCRASHSAAAKSNDYRIESTMDRLRACFCHIDHRIATCIAPSASRPWLVKRKDGRRFWVVRVLQSVRMKAAAGLDLSEAESAAGSTRMVA
jgi:hypothetical protein